MLLSVSTRTPQVPFGMRCWLPNSPPRPHPIRSPPIFYFEPSEATFASVCLSVNKHFQHVEKNNLAWRSPPSGCDEPVHLSQPPALFLAAAETVSSRQLFKEPHIKGGKVERLASYFSILAPTSYKSSTANLLPPRFRFFTFPSPPFAKNHSEPIKTSLLENV